MDPGDRNEQLFAELDHREADGLAVTLVWNRVDDTVSVVVFDDEDDTSLEFRVPPERARDAFAHPFAFKVRRG
jgi:hypothetical protein